jgi:hypothetical protein
VEDGTVLHGDVYRPIGDGRYPVIATHGPYGKGLAFQEGFVGPWKALAANHPEVLAGSSNKYQNRETADPERSVPDGHVVIRVDARGAGRPPARAETSVSYWRFPGQRSVQGHWLIPPSCSCACHGVCCTRLSVH